MSYNGYPTEQDYRAALVARFPAYAAERAETTARNPEGMRHSDCHHANGYCAERTELASRDASLGVGHVWTAVGCPAYRSLVPADCACRKGA